MTIAKLNARRKKAGLPLIRFDLRQLRADDLQDLRDAYAAMYEISSLAVGDSRGYIAFARGHGYDRDLCHNDDQVFLTWHRAYIYMFEKGLSSALRWKRKDEELELTLPFWDWTVTDPATDASNGIPRAVGDATYVDAAGQQRDNPLASAPSLYRTENQGLSGGAANTARYPSRFATRIPLLATWVAKYMTNPRFDSFSSDLDGEAHGTVHVYVGGADPSSPLPRTAGDMSAVVSAAYDPIFWLHHAMVDKVWFDWQTRNGNATVPQHVREAVVYGDFTGEELIDAERSLRYIYSSESVEAAEEVGETIPDSPDDDDAVIQPAAAVAPVVSPVTVDVGEVQGPFKRAQLDFHQMRPPRSSFEVRAFINNRQATVDTPVTDPTYGGTLMLFGHGQCHGAPGHCDPKLAVRDDYDKRPKHPLRFEHTAYCIDVTGGLRRAIGNLTSPVRIDVTLVVTDAMGNLVDPRVLRHRGISLATRS